MSVAGGAGSGVAEYLDAEGSRLPRLHIGLPDGFIEHGSREDCLARPAWTLRQCGEHRGVVAKSQSGLKNARGATKLVAGGGVSPCERR